MIRIPGVIALISNKPHGIQYFYIFYPLILKQYYDTICVVHIVKVRCVMGKSKNSFCGPRSNTKGRFLEACLLCLLGERESYGYSLMENLSEFGYIEDEVDISTIYRKLKAMEKENLVTSFWTKSEQGPKKRVYTITDLGKEKLDHWITFLKERKKRITLITNKYKTLKR